MWKGVVGLQESKVSHQTVVASSCASCAAHRRVSLVLAIQSVLRPRGTQVPGGFPNLLSIQSMYGVCSLAAASTAGAAGAAATIAAAAAAAAAAVCGCSRPELRLGLASSCSMFESCCKALRRSCHTRRQVLTQFPAMALACMMLTEGQVQGSLLAHPKPADSCSCVLVGASCCVEAGSTAGRAAWHAVLLICRRRLEGGMCSTVVWGVGGLGPCAGATDEELRGMVVGLAELGVLPSAGKGRQGVQGIRASMWGVNWQAVRVAAACCSEPEPCSPCC
jgi:hypothetical protein